MAAVKRGEERESNVAACLATLVFANGMLLCGVSLAALRSGAIYLIDRLVTFDTAWHAKAAGSDVTPVVITTRKVYQTLIFVGLLVVMSGMLGVLGAKSRNRFFVCTYVLLATLFTMVTLAAGVHTMQRRTIVEPLIARQVMDICNSTTYIRLASSIPCDWAENYASSEVTPCGVYCRYRANLLRQLKGCVVMPRLCQQFFYEEIESTNCAASIREGNSTMYLASESSESCRELCDQDIRCTAYAYSGASAFKPQRCLLGQGIASQHKPPMWSPVRPAMAAEYLAGGGSISCFRRGAPMLLDKFKKHGLRLAVSTLTLGLVLLASSAISFCLMYNVNFKRRGLPKALELAAMMCCPCCALETRQRFYEPNLSDSDFSDDEAGSDGATSG